MGRTALLSKPIGKEVPLSGNPIVLLQQARADIKRADEALNRLGRDGDEHFSGDVGTAEEALNRALKYVRQLDNKTNTEMR